MADRCDLPDVLQMGRSQRGSKRSKRSDTRRGRIPCLQCEGNFSNRIYQKYYARQICLEDIAEYAGVSRVYLSQIFKKETGKNISDYLVEYRLGKAKELLLNSNLKIYTDC